ncbi:MAG TPA: hypothetical protein VK150_05765 [Geothrix sp.]|nr:hypothetical protein [Geothrix sp.]
MAPAEDRRGWHLNRGISVEAIVALLGLLAAGLSFAVHQDGRSTRSEEQIKFLTETDQRHDKAIESLDLKTSKKLDRIEEKLDRVLENRRR